MTRRRNPLASTATTPSSPAPIWTRAQPPAKIVRPGAPAHFSTFIGPTGDHALLWADAIMAVASGEIGDGSVKISAADLLRAARILQGRARADEAARSSGRRRAAAKHAERRARWDAEIVAAAKANKLGPLVAKHKRAREAAKAKALRLQLNGQDEDGKTEKRLVADAGLPRATIYEIAAPFLRRKK